MAEIVRAMRQDLNVTKSMSKTLASRRYAYEMRHMIYRYRAFAISKVTTPDLA